MSKYFKLDKDKREIVLDKTKRYNVNIDILDLIIDLKQEIERLNNIINEIKNAFEDKNIHNNMELVRKIKNILKEIDKGE